MKRDAGSLSPDAPKCPQCTHPVIVNRADCRGCGRAYHELCLKRGCTNGASCGSAAAAAAASGPGKWLALPFLAATIGLGVAYFRFGGKLTASTWFGPALGTGLVGMVAGLKIGDSPPEGAKCRAGRFGGWLLLLAALGAGAIAGTGREVPYTAHLTALGAAGGALAALGLLVDRDKRLAVLHVLLAAHLYLVGALILSPGFPRTMVARLRHGGLSGGAGPGAGGGGGAGPAGGGGGIGSLLGISSGGADVQIKGVMKVGGRMQAMTQTGSYGVGDTIPGAGTVHAINDVEVVIRSAGGQLTKYAVPH